MNPKDNFVNRTTKAAREMANACETGSVAFYYGDGSVVLLRLGPAPVQNRLPPGPPQREPTPEPLWIDSTRHEP